MWIQPLVQNGVDDLGEVLPVVYVYVHVCTYIYSFIPIPIFILILKSVETEERSWLIYMNMNSYNFFSCPYTVFFWNLSQALKTFDLYYCETIKWYKSYTLETEIKLQTTDVIMTLLSYNWLTGCIRDRLIDQFEGAGDVCRYVSASHCYASSSRYPLPWTPIYIGSLPKCFVNQR